MTVEPDKSTHGFIHTLIPLAAVVAIAIVVHLALGQSAYPKRILLERKTRNKIQRALAAVPGGESTLSGA